MVSSICLFLLSAAVASAAAATVPAATTVDIRVTDRHGRPLQSAHVLVDGMSEREGDTDAAGRVVFRNMTTGAYKVQVERDAFITLRKDFTVWAEQGPTSVVAALSPAAPVAALLPAAPVAASITRRALSPNEDVGTPQTVSIPDLAEKHLIGRHSVKESPIGCSGLTGARLIQVIEPLIEHTHADAEEMLYVVAGEGALTVDGKVQSLKSGWFSIIPRGIPYALVRTGRNPVILLSVLGGQPCRALLTRTDR